MSKISDRIDELLESGVKDPHNILGGLADKSEEMTPQEFHEYLYSSAPYFKQMLGASLDDLPEVKALLLTEPQWGVKPDSYAKLFGKTDVTEEEFLRDFDKIPSDEAKYIAEAKGLNYADMLKDIEQRRNEQLRKDVADESTLLKIVAPKSLQAVKEGRDVKPGEGLTDIVTDVTYAIPWGKFVNNPLVKSVFGNFAAPAINEVAEALGTDEEKGIGERLSNVAVGGLVNLSAPKVVGKLVGSVPGGEHIEKYINQKTSEELAKETAKKLAKQKQLTRSALLKQQVKDKRNMTVDEYNLMKGNAKKMYNQGPLEVFAGSKEVVESPVSKTWEEASFDIAKRNGKTFNEKFKNATSETKEWFNKQSDAVKDKFVSNTLETYDNAFKTGNSTLLNWSQGVESYGTNKFGDWFYGGDLSRVRGVGTILNKLDLVESQAEKERKARLEEKERNKQKIRNELKSRGLLMEGR